ncbi:substrate-binding periplasmic protein [Bdellovibrio sp. HCB337]|uniref:substrate-binding periplasmic protein n=1 Tax=Bdellovibrio sp. HCB337 TaxID=3394358 RepID=UPI0039A54C4E
MALIIPSLSFALATSETEPQVVKVGVVEFPPYIQIENNGQVSGMIGLVLEYLNAAQDDYVFQPIPTSAMRRHRDFKNGMYDQSFFDNVEWGWDKSTVDATDVYMTGKEIYIALKKPGRGESYFANFSQKSMVGILGYHYGFAAFNSDPTYLRKKFNMQTSTSNEGSIKMILFERGDIAIVSDAFLNEYLKRHPDDRKKLLISEKVDQNYNHTIVIRKNTRPSVQEMNTLMSKFKQSKQFKLLQEKYGVQNSQ